MVNQIPDFSRKRAALHTLGCRLNQAETQLVKEKLERAGYDVVPFSETADVGIINTCTVTREADAKCRQAIRGFIRRNPSAFTAVIGCYSQMGAKAIAEIEGVDLIIGNQEKLSVLDYLALGKNSTPLVVRERIDKSDFSIHFAGETPYRRRANLKVQDGCDFMCAFCVIPAARGRCRSRRFELPVLRRRDQLRHALEPDARRAADRKDRSPGATTLHHPGHQPALQEHGRS